uniref:Guanylate cyclase domain-containing protein n=1 Tax=Hanusia phi TaxID=3032 RepID=A0A7S0EZP1_9CRYP|mmetsp:Transcript_34331/g.77322  ORF Transcript_34331/g.77322 Transcript_34331/m.77322 type:complete len:1238 (+) Transcript_34331:76-3789(+)
MPSILEFASWLSERERKGWTTGAYYKTLDDFHLVLLCRKYSQDLQKINPTLERVVAANLFERVENSQTATASESAVSTNDVEVHSNSKSFSEIPEEEAEGGELAEQTHLFAKFTCSYKIWDFLQQVEKGVIASFPQNDMIEGALVFSDLSGFSKLCESYVDKFSGRHSAEAMAKASEKLNLVVNSVFELQIRLVDLYNGDVVNFAGDAMFVLFHADDIATAAQRAAACALAMLDGVAQRLKAMEEMGMDELDTQLFLHIGVGAGKIRCMTFGGEFDKAEFVAAGPALTEAKDCGELAKCGEAVISETVFGLCKCLSPDVAQIGQSRMAGVDGLGETNYYVLRSLKEQPQMPEVTARQALLNRLRNCDSGEVEEAMRRFVPHSISACVDSGQSPKEAEESRRVTIMFIRLLDIECEPFDYSKAETVQLVQKCILEIYAMLHRYEGTVSRFQIDDKGTVLKIVFGFPLMAHEDDPVRSVHAAIEIRKNLKAINVQSCIGIATGYTICGLVGNDVRLEYTAVGSSVILAARLMQNANCCIFVNQDTYRSSCGSAVFEKICSIKVKGRDDKIKVYRPVESERRITKKLAPMHDSEGILGRDKEVEELRSSFAEYLEHHAADNTCPSHYFVVSGPAGIGKATLLGRFLGLATEVKNLRILKSTAEAVESKTPYHPWKKVLASLLGVDMNTKPTQFTTRACVTALYNIMGEELEKHSALNDVLPTNFPAERGAEALDSRSRRIKLTEIIVKLFNATAEKSPLLIVMHACQFFDNSSSSLLRQILRRCKGTCVLVSTRSEAGLVDFADLEKYGCRTKLLPLLPLSKELSIQLVKKTLGVSELEQGIVDVVMNRTQGIPFYCVEFARVVKDSPGGAVSELPDTITGAILLRIDRLLPAPKLVLKIVAVAGKNVRASLIADVVPAQFTTEDLQAELEYLVSLDILIRDRNGYCFRHEMVQEVVLGFLTFSQKRFLHKRIANYYVNSDAEVSAATLAIHFELAAKGMDQSELDVPACKRAIWFLKVAAEEAMKANAIDDANKYLARCHDLMHLIPSSADPFDLEMALGLVDGNELLLRQVLEQFRENSQTSVRKIADVIREREDAGSNRDKIAEKQKEWLEAIRFEARSIASAASTLGAEDLSTSALDVENSALEVQDWKDVLAAIHTLDEKFSVLCGFIDSMSGRGLQREGDRNSANLSSPGNEDKGLEASDSTTVTPAEAEGNGNSQESHVLDEMMRDQPLFKPS